MHIEFDAMILQDFKSFRGQHYLDIGSLVSGVHFLKGLNRVAGQLGSNGAGKSTIWDALCWCLYGRTVEGLRNPDVRVWGGPKQSMVSVAFLVDGELRSVRRSTNPNRLTIDDHEVGQEQVDALVGMTHKTFLHAVLLGQGQPLFLDLQPGDMLALFSDVLGLSRWEERSAQARDAVAKRKENVQRLEMDVEIAIAHVAGFKDHRALVKAEADAWLGSVKEQKRELSKVLFDLRRNDKTLKYGYDEAVIAEDLAAAEVRIAEEHLKRVGVELDEWRESLIAARVANDRVYEDRCRIEEELKKLGNAKVCPTCGRPIKGTHLEPAISELRERLEALDEPGVLGKLNSTVEAFEAREKQMMDARAALGELMSRQQDLASLVRVTETSVKDNARALVETQQAINKLESADSPFAAQLESVEAKLENARVELSNKKDLLAKAKRFVARYEFWVKGFKDIRLRVLGDVLAELEVVSNAMLETVGLFGWELTFDVERETKSGTITPGINVDVHAPGRPETTKWKSFSGGERQRLRVVVSLALSEVLLSHAGLFVNFVALDEPTQHLSDTGIDDLVTLLAEFAQDRERKVFYTDHHSIEGNRFASVLTVEKTDAGSSFVL